MPLQRLFCHLTGPSLYRHKSCSRLLLQALQQRPSVHHRGPQSGLGYAQVCFEKLLQRTPRLLQAYGGCLSHWFFPDDTGVIISYNTEGPKNVEENAINKVVLPGAISINPLNWKRDETYASAEENQGSLVLNQETGEREIVDLGVDAQVNLARGVIVTNTTAPVTDMPDYFGPASFHENDYSFFYKNLQENVAKRIAAYQEK